MLCLPLCLFANQTAGSYLNKRFPGTPIQCSVSPFFCSLCLPFLEKKVCVWLQTLWGVDAAWGESRRLPFLCFIPSYLIFFSLPLQCDSGEEGAGCLSGLGCNCTPQLEWVGRLHWGLERGRDIEKQREKDRCKRMSSSKRQSCYSYRETDEWVTSQWRGGEGVWNWFGGGARGGDSGFRQADTFLPSSVRGCLSWTVSVVRLSLFSIPANSLDWTLIQIMVSVGMLFPLIPLLQHVCPVMWGWRATENERKGRCAVQLSWPKYTVRCLVWKSVCFWLGMNSWLSKKDFSMLLDVLKLTRITVILLQLSNFTEHVLQTHCLVAVLLSCNVAHAFPLGKLSITCIIPQPTPVELEVLL